MIHFEDKFIIHIYCTLRKLCRWQTRAT